MSEIGQVVAALAGGAILAIATMAVLQPPGAERRPGRQSRTDQQRRIDTAVESIMEDVEVFRRDWPPDPELLAGKDGTDAEVYTRAHLRLISNRPGPRPDTGRSGPPAHDRAGRAPRFRARSRRR